LLEVRRGQSAFHPDADQGVLELPGDGLLGFYRRSETQLLVVLANLCDQPRQIGWLDLESPPRRDLLADEQLVPGEPISMRPFQVRWLTESAG
jgi:sucrose phosphorylase